MKKATSKLPYFNLLTSIIQLASFAIKLLFPYISIQFNITFFYSTILQHTITQILQFHKADVCLLSLDSKMFRNTSSPQLYIKSLLWRLLWIGTNLATYYYAKILIHPSHKTWNLKSSTPLTWTLVSFPLTFFGTKKHN